MLAAIPTHASSTNDIATYARPFWEKATGLGTANATTSFHKEYNKRDINRVRGQHNRYTGQRAMSLGFMKGGVKMMKFLTSDEGRSLVGVDCSKPGAGGQARQNRIRGVGEEFLALAARYSKLREYEAGDVEAISKARDMEVSTFATFVGFSYAVVSPEFYALKRKWLAAERAEQAAQQPLVAPVLPATPLAVVVGVQLPPTAAPAAAPEQQQPPRSSSVVDTDSSDDEGEDAEVVQTNGNAPAAAAPAAPPPAPGPSTVHVDSNGIETIPTVVIETEHEESILHRVNTPAQYAPAPAPATPSNAAEPASERQVSFASELQSRVDAQHHGAFAARSAAAANPKPKFAPKPVAMPQVKAVKRSAPPNMQPAQGPRKKQAPSPAAAAAMEGVDLKALGHEILAAFNAAKRMHKRNVYDANNSPILSMGSVLYRVVTKRRMDGVSAGTEDTHVNIYAPLKGAIIGKLPLRSRVTIEKAFGIQKQE